MQPAGGAIVGLGEVLWDLLPGGRQLGGAPFNFAFHCHQLGWPSVMVSRVGADDLGRDIRAGLRERGLADLRRRYGPELACLTRGARGCLLQTADEEIAVPGRPVAVVDTVGAGDAFTAGLLVLVLEGRTLAEAASFANRLAARVAGEAG